MKKSKLLLFLFLILPLFNIYSQSDLENEVYNKFNDDKFQDLKILYKSLNNSEINVLSDSSLYVIAFTFFVDDDCDVALEIYNKILQRTPTHENSYFYISKCNFKQNKFDDAIKNIDRAIEVSDDKIWFTFEKGVLYYEMKRFSDAETIFKSLIDTDSLRSGKLYYYYASALLNQRKDKEALISLKLNENKISPESDFLLPVRYLIGVLENDFNNYHSSNFYLLQLLNTEFENSTLLSKLVQNYNGLGKFDSASVMAAKLYSLHKNNSDEKSKTFVFYSKETDTLIVDGVEEFMDPDPDKKYPFYKNKFNFYDGDGKFKFSIQAELLFGTGGEIPPIFVMGRSEYKNDKYLHKTFGTLNSKYPLNYRFLFESLMKILNNEVNPTSSSESTVKDKE